MVRPRSVFRGGAHSKIAKFCCYVYKHTAHCHKGSPSRSSSCSYDALVGAESKSAAGASVVNARAGGLAAPPLQETFDCAAQAGWARWAATRQRRKLTRCFWAALARRASSHVGG